MEEISYGTTTLHYDLEYSDRKSMAIEVHPDKSIWVIAPLDTEKTEVERHLLKRARWVLRQQQYFDQFLPRLPERQYIGGEAHYYLGRKYMLVVRKQTRKDVKLRGGELQVSSPNTDPEVVKALLASWYYSHSMPKFREVFEECLPLFKRFNIGSPTLDVRRMKYRWGSCLPPGSESITDGKVIINPEVIKAPKRCMQYVIIHELCHLVIPHHNKAFYSLLGELMPEWERWKLRLEGVVGM